MTDPFHPDYPPDYPTIEQRANECARDFARVIEHGFERPTWVDVDRLAHAGRRLADLVAALAAHEVNRAIESAIDHDDPRSPLGARPRPGSST